MLSSGCLSTSLHEVQMPMQKRGCRIVKAYFVLYDAYLRVPTECLVTSV